ncbi:mitochondrial-processing peptidase subunit alpha [Diutina catenulata]
MLRGRLAPVKRCLSTATAPVQTSKLANGVTVVTDPTPGHFTALGAYVNAGSRYENPEKPGLSHIWDRLAWKSTEKYSGTQMLQNLSEVGGNFMCSAQRESMFYQASVFNHDVDRMVDAIAQTVRVPRVTDSELEETLQTAAYEVSEISNKHETWLPEVLHAAAYHHNTLGNPLYCPPARLGEIDRAEVMDYHHKFYQPYNVVLAMVGVDHQRAVDLAQKEFGDWKATAEPFNRPEVKYTGGELALPYQPPLYANLPELVHIQIGFETTGLLDEDLYALATLQKLLGGGSSFSAGGPGKGMFSRLYTRVLNQYGFVENCSCFNHSYVDSGLFGITLSCAPDAAHIMSQIICFELAKILEPESKGGLNQREVTRAKNQLTSSLLMSFESKLAKLEDMGRQVQCQGKVTTVDEMISKIDRLTIDDLRKVAEKVLTGKVVTNHSSSGVASVVMQGDREKFGDVDFILQHFGLGQHTGPKLTEPRDMSKVKKRFSWFS